MLIIFSGKAHPNDVPGQELIKSIHEYSRRPEFEGKIILLEGYDIALARKLVTMLMGYIAVLLVQIWGVYWQTLKMLSFNFGPEVQQVVADVGISASVIALAYQLGALIFPPLIPVIVWVLASWHEIEQFTGWKSRR